jgi:hypothetical protein
MMLAFDDTCTRAVVKNTFIHIESASANFNEYCRLKRRKSDASHIRYSAQSELALDIDLKTEASPTPCSVAAQAELGVAVNFAAVRPIVKNTFLHVEAVEENNFDTKEVTRRRRRLHSDLLHVRNTDAESYKLEKETSILAESETLDVFRRDSETSLGCLSVCTVDSACSTSAGGSELQPQESAGSAEHSQGLCRPCVWFWRPSSCSKGSSCEYCHMCDEGAVARAVASKKAMRKNRTKTVASC